MKQATSLEQIRKYFGYLFDEYGFNVVAETHFESFGNWVVVLQSDDCRIRIIQDREEISVALGPLWSIPGWQAGPWYDLAVITAFLTQGNSTVEYRSTTTDRQLEQLAEVLHSRYDQIRELFQGETFRQRQAELELLRDQFNEQIWESMMQRPR